MAAIDTVAASVITAFMFTAFALLLFMIVVQPLWCLVDCAVARRRSGASKGVWIVVLVLLYGVANWFYGAFAAEGAWLRRLTRLAWLFAILLVLSALQLRGLGRRVDLGG